MPKLEPIKTVSVRTHVNDFGGFSSAALVMCDDAEKYVIKRATLGRPLVAEQIVARLGVRIGAPCMHVALANVPDELIKADPKLGRFAGGPAHASKFIDGLFEAKQIRHQDHPLNRARFALLYLLYSWTHAADHQYMYELKPPNLVFSHDHGLFFVGSEKWSNATLAAGRIPQFDGPLGSLVFTPAELSAGAAELASVSEAELAELVSAVPPGWGVNPSELAEVVTYLSARRAALLGMLPNA